MSTLLYDGIRAADILGFLRGYGFDSHQHTNNLSGWLGDTTKWAGNSISIGLDDYKADLDSVNLISRMKENGQSYLRAAKDYYAGVEQYQEEIQRQVPENERQGINRAHEFTQNHSLEEVLDELKRSDSRSQKPFGLTDEELKEKNPVGYQFYDNLRKGVTGDE